MKPPTSPTPERGQAESIGSVLFLGVVVVSVSAFGVFYLAHGFAGTGGADVANGGSVTLHGDVDRERVELAHGGGRSLRTADLRVLVRTDSGTTEYDFDPDLTTDGDGAFEAGESWRLDWNRSVGEELTVTVVDVERNRVLFEETHEVRPTPTPEDDEPARGETPTATP